MAIPITMEVCLGSLSIWKTHLRPSFNFLTDVLRCCFNISTSFSYLTVPSILWSAPDPPAAKHPDNMMLPPPCFTSLFPPNITMVIMAKQFYFCFIRPEDISQKSMIFVPCAVANHSQAFLWRFWSNGFFLAERPFRLCWYRTCFTVDINIFAPV